MQVFHQTPQSHWYASAAETYRAFAELGEVWSTLGKSSGRADVADHGAELLKLAPLLYRDLHASLNKVKNIQEDLCCEFLKSSLLLILKSSLNKTANTTASPGHTCYPHRADGPGSYNGTSGPLPLLLYSLSHLCYSSLQ